MLVRSQALSVVTPFHHCCITRWLNTRPCCPLCNSTWVFPDDLTLAQRAAVSMIDDETALVDLVNRQLPNDIFETLDYGMRDYAKQPLPLAKQLLLGHAFAQYLPVSELEAPCATQEEESTQGRGKEGRGSSSKNRSRGD